MNSRAGAAGDTLWFRLCRLRGVASRYSASRERERIFSRFSLAVDPIFDCSALWVKHVLPTRGSSSYVLEIVFSCKVIAPRLAAAASCHKESPHRSLTGLLVCPRCWPFKFEWFTYFSRTCLCSSRFVLYAELAGRDSFQLRGLRD